MTDNQAEANSSLVTPLKTNTLSPVKSSNASDQIALLPTAEPIDNNNSVYQNYDAMCRNSSYNNRETIICDAPLNKNSGKDAKETKEDYYNFVVRFSHQINLSAYVQKTKSNSKINGWTFCYRQLRIQRAALKN